MTKHHETTITMFDGLREDAITIPIKTDTREVLMDLRASNDGAYRFIRALTRLVIDSDVKALLTLQKVNGPSHMKVMINEQPAADIEITEIGDDQVVHYAAHTRDGEFLVLMAHGEASAPMSKQERVAHLALKTSAMAKNAGQRRTCNDKPITFHSRHYDAMFSPKRNASPKKATRAEVLAGLTKRFGAEQVATLGLR